MPQINALPAEVTPGGTDVFPMQTAAGGGGSTKKVTLTNLLATVAALSGATFTGAIVLASFTDATRGAAGTAGKVIYNTDDLQLNIDNGTNWTLPDGTTT